MNVKIGIFLVNCVQNVMLVMVVGHQKDLQKHQTKLNQIIKSIKLLN